MFPLRLCPSASVPSNVVSRCTWPGQGSRTSRTTNTMSRGLGVHGHTRSGADDESRTRGLDHGVVALCLLSYIRKGARRTVGQYRRASRGNLLKNVHRCRWCDPSIAGLCQCAGRLKPGMKKARILAESGPLRTELGGVRLCAHLSRMHRVLVPIKLSIARGQFWMQCARATRRLHRRGAHERNQTLHGSACSDDVAGFHDESLEKIGAR